jgi:hypothetical protein
VLLRDPAAWRRFDVLVVTEPTGGDQELGAVLLGELRGVFQVRLREGGEVLEHVVVLKRWGR